MYHYTVHNDRTPKDTFLKSLSKSSHLLIRGLIKGLSPSKAIFSSFTIEMYHYTVHNDRIPQDTF